MRRPLPPMAFSWKNAGIISTGGFEEGMMYFTPSDVNQ